MINLKLINLLILILIKLITAENDQLINFVPDTNDFDLIASETNQFSSVVDLTTNEYQRECVEAHNAKRRLHGSEDLFYDEKLLNDAKEAAQQSAINGKLTRLMDSEWGENLASSTKKLTCTNVVSLWYKQNKFYNYHVPMYRKETGGFTQLIWRETRRFACAQARLKNVQRFFTVCVYDPFGNVSGQFRANVQPPITVNPNMNNIKINNNLSNLTTTTSEAPTIISTTIKSIIEIKSNHTNENNSSNSDNTSDIAILNRSPVEIINPVEPSRTSSLVKPILNKSYRLSPGMLVKLKNQMNRRKLETLNEKRLEDNLEASASELNLFVKLNTISPSLDTSEISNTIQRIKNDTLNSILTSSSLSSKFETTTQSNFEYDELSTYSSRIN